LRRLEKRGNENLECYSFTPPYIVRDKNDAVDSLDNALYKYHINL